MNYNKINLYRDKIEEVFNIGWTIPITCEIDLSNRCCLNCNFCIFKKSELDLDENLYFKIINNLQRIGINSITFTGGGEPLMNPKIKSIIHSTKGFKLGLITNGVLLDKLSSDDINKFEFIRVSLNASTTNTYKQITGQYLFQKVLDNINHIRVIFHNTLGISFVVTKDNIDEIPLMEELSRDLKVDYVQFKSDVKNPIDFSAENKTVRYKAEDSLPCSIASLIGVIGADGKVYYCCQYRYDRRYELGDLRWDNFETIWQRRKMIHPIQSECLICRYTNYAHEYIEGSKILHREFL